MQQEITSAIFLTLTGYGKVKLAWVSPRRRRLFGYPLPYFPNEVLILMLAPSTPNCVTSLLSRRLKGKGILGAQKAQKAREGEGRKPPPLLPSPSSAVSRPNSFPSLSNFCHTGCCVNCTAYSWPASRDMRTDSVRPRLSVKSGSSKCTRKPNHLSEFVGITLNFECHVHTLVVDSMKSVLKIDGGDASKVVEEEPEIIENNFLARGKS